MKNPTESKPKIIITIIVCTLIMVSLVSNVSAQSTVVNAEASTSQAVVGHNLTVDIKISDVQNLFGVDVTLNWNTIVLNLVSATSQLGVESHLGGVLHETSSYPIEVLDDTASQSTGEYRLLATSTGSASPFSGSGTIVTLTFTVISPGPTGLTVTSELSDHPASGGTANLIDHTDTADSVTAITSGSSSTPGTSPTIPEFSSLAILAMLISVTTATIVMSTKLLKNRRSWSIKTVTEL